MKKTLASAVVSCGLLSLIGATSATQYSWDLSKNYTTGLSNSGDPSAHELKFKSIPVGFNDLLVTAFRSGSGSGSGGLLVDALVNPDGTWGLGVDSTSAGYEDSTDKRFLDNKSGFDVLVFDSQAANFDWGSVSLGSIWSGNPNPVLTYWTGGDSLAGADIGNAGFNTLCLTASGCTAALGSGLAGSLSKSFSGPQSLATNGNTNLTLPTAAKGRYLVISGALDGGGGTGYDKVKIGTVPAPQTVGLLGIGLLAMIGMRRRRAAPRTVHRGLT